MKKEINDILFKFERNEICIGTAADSILELKEKPFIDTKNILGYNIACVILFLPTGKHFVFLNVDKDTLLRFDRTTHWNDKPWCMQCISNSGATDFVVNEYASLIPKEFDRKEVVPFYDYYGKMKQDL